MLNRMHSVVAIVLISTASLRAGVRDAVVKIGGCSGVCVDPSGLVLSAKHCDHPERVTVEFNDRTVAAERVYESPATEGPVVYDCDGDGYPFAIVADGVPTVLSPVWSLGYPQYEGVRSLRRTDGVLLRGGRFTFQDGAFRGNVVSFPTGSGWSGGPLFDADGRVIGILSSSDCFTSVFVSFAATRVAYETALGHTEPETREDPTLYVFTLPNCGPCEQFKDDFAEDGEFRRQLQKRFTVVFVDVESQPELAKQYGVTQVPTFITAGREPVVGYENSEALLTALGIGTDAVTATPDNIGPLKPEQTPVDDPEPEQPAADPVPALADENDRIDHVLSAVETAASLATWLGVGGATGGAGGLALGAIALWRTLRRRRRPPARDPPEAKPPPVAPPPVVTRESPPPQTIVPETRFAPYERDTFAEAYAWAEGELARKYPGAVGTLESLKGLIDQYLSAKGIGRGD